MAESRGDERTSIGVLIKSHKKYGSTSNHIARNETYIKHIITPDDTLQGIALKYGVTTEQIRRVNRIWTNDSLFVRKTLDIPVLKDSADAFSLGNGDSSSATSAGSSIIEESDQLLPNQLVNNSSVISENCDQPSQMDKSDQTVADILVRIDSTIALTKNKVQKMELNQEFLENIEDPYSIHQRLHGSTLQHSLLRASSDPNVGTHSLVMTQGRKVRSSLQRLEQQQDELFEL